MDLSLPNRQRARDASFESPVKSTDDSLTDTSTSTPTDTPRKRKRKSSEPKKRLTDFSIKRLCFDDSPRSSPSRSIPDMTSVNGYYKLDEPDAVSTPRIGSPNSNDKTSPLYAFMDSPLGAPHSLPPPFLPPHTLSPYSSLFRDSMLPGHNLPYPLRLLPISAYSLLPGLYPGLPLPLSSPTALPSPLAYPSPLHSMLTPGRRESYSDDGKSPTSVTGVTNTKEPFIKHEAMSPGSAENYKDSHASAAQDRVKKTAQDMLVSPFQDHDVSSARRPESPNCPVKINKPHLTKPPLIIRNGTAFPFTANSAAFLPVSPPATSQNSPNKAINELSQSCSASTTGSLSPGSASSQGGSGGDGCIDKRLRKNYKNMTRERRVEANARERSRVHTISAAFEELRNVVPTYTNNQKLSKLAILRIACSYILALARLAGHDYSIDQSNMSFEECVELCSSTIQNETKPKRR